MTGISDGVLASFPRSGAAAPAPVLMAPFASTAGAVRSALHVLGMLAAELNYAGLHSSACVVQAMGEVIRQEGEELAFIPGIQGEIPDAEA